jgi:hypothetical protein
MTTDSEAIYTTLKDVWPDLHKWILCLLSFPFEGDFSGLARNSCCSAITCYADNDNMRNLIASTPGVITKLTQLWLDEISNQTPAVVIQSPFPVSASGALQKYTHRPKPEWIEEMIIATGGYPRGFALLALDSVRARIKDSDPTKLDLKSLSPDLEIVTDLCRGEMDDLVEVILSPGASQTISNVMTCLLSYKGSDCEKAAECLFRCVDYFHLGLKYLHGSSWACTMLEAPIIVSILQVVRWSSYLYDQALAGVLEDMTLYLVYRSVLRLVERGIEKISELGSSTIPMDTQVNQRMACYCEVAGLRWKICSIRFGGSSIQVCGNEVVSVFCF